MELHGKLRYDIIIITCDSCGEHSISKTTNTHEKRLNETRN